MITAAAIRHEGKIHTGRAHHLILNAAVPFGSLKTGEQGFINHKGHFLDRFAAFDHATGCGQLAGRTKHGQADKLFSEDLW